LAGLNRLREENASRIITFQARQTTFPIVLVSWLGQDRNIVEIQPDTRFSWLRVCLIVLALSYALFAGLHTVSDLDLGWQLATGRYVVQHHQIPRVDFLSYTAQGHEWIYPPFSGAFFYLVYLAGGYSALSWIGAVACLAATALLISAGGRLAPLLAIVAVPAIAFRTIPRAELFTTVLFSAVLAIVWRHHQGKKTRLWLLPLLFFLWVNLHLGFISGLGLLGAAVVCELCELPFTERRSAAVSRLKNLLPWAAASGLATLANPWGWRIYEAIVRQNQVMGVHSAFIGEWSGAHLNWLALQQAVDVRNPASADWWLLAVSGLAVLVAVWKKLGGPVVLLLAGMYLSVQHLRFQALFAALAVVVGGTILSGFLAEIAARKRLQATASEARAVSLMRQPALWVAVVLAILVVLRIADLVSNRYYIDSGQITFFGTGASWWYPERAATFLKREGLPGNVFHDYNLGGYLTWAIGPQYPDFVDGRYVPFGEQLFDEQKRLASVGPDSPDWRAATDRWQFNTAIFSVARYAGLGTFALQDFCASGDWKLVYIDDVSVIFVRNHPKNAELIGRLGIRCENAQIAAPVAASGNSRRGQAERFNYLMNAGSIYYALSRDTEAASMLTKAEQIFPNDSGLHLVKAQLLVAVNRLSEAEGEFLRVLSVHPSDAAWFALAQLYSNEHRYPEALHCVQQAASLSQTPYERVRSSGLIYLYMNQPQNALAAFARSERESPYTGKSSEVAREFSAKISEGRARAYRQMKETDRAITEQKLATSLTPENPLRWSALAELYEAQGNARDALEARQRAKSIQDAAKSRGNSSPAH